MKFLIQKINGEIKHDFSFTLLQSIDYQKWLNPSSNFSIIFNEKPNFPSCIPIGTVEFVSEYLQQYYSITPKPINIPHELLDYLFTMRSIKNGTETDIQVKSFVKSNDKIKGFAEITTIAPSGNYQISDIIEIESEWRAFVYNKKLVGLQNYSGEFDMFPNVKKIRAMIDRYTSQPIAYTLDVGIHQFLGTFIIEIHDFFSCALYGFADFRILPSMFSRWFNEYTNLKSQKFNDTKSKNTTTNIQKSNQ